jgi:kynurenine formamidase
MRVIDLSLPIDRDMPGVHVTSAKRLEVEGWNATTLSLYSHCGTHMDAPFHFLGDGQTLDQQDLSVCVGPATVINLSPALPSQLITVDDLGDLGRSIQPGSRLLFRTDWYKRYGTPAYRNELPRISLELAKWLVQRKVAMIGVEPPSVADVNNMQELTDVHQTLFRGNVLIVEGLANLDQLRSSEVEFTALPLRIAGGDGSPVRAIAVERDTHGSI